MRILGAYLTRKSAVLDSRHILVVEDEALISMLIEEDLQRRGARTSSAACISDALQLVEDVIFDAAVLDCKIGRDTVMPVADRLAELSVPFVFLTGYGDGWNRGAHEAAPLLSKPHAPDWLELVLTSLLRP
jgi:CheY-like chemotaxis protein